jgi:hypothetical protein
MILNTEKEYKQLCERAVYYNNRWDYYSVVMALISEGYKEGQALELGSMNYPILTDSHTIDIETEFTPYYLFDADKTPWPIADKRYSLFIGLQVLEHLQDQRKVFSEIIRTCNNAIISLPYKWDKPGDCHNGIDEEVIYKWTGLKPDKEIKIGARIVCEYNFRE